MIKKLLIIGEFPFFSRWHQQMLIEVIGLIDDVTVVIVRKDKKFYQYSALLVQQALGKFFINIDYTKVQIYTQHLDEVGIPNYCSIHSITHILYCQDNFEIAELIPLSTFKIAELIPLSTSIATTLHEVDLSTYDFAQTYTEAATEFLPYINKKIVISGIESAGKTVMVQKLAAYFQTACSLEVGKTYSDRCLGLQEKTFQPQDFVYIAMAQLLQNQQQNILAKKYLIIDTDPIVTRYYLDLYKTDILLLIDNEAYIKAVHTLDALIDMFKSQIDRVLFLEPTVAYIENGKRWNSDNNKRQQLNNMLKALYVAYNIPIISIASTSYAERFAQCLQEISNVDKLLFSA